MIAMFAAQVGYQLRMLARNPRGLMVSLFAPGLILALLLSRGAQHSASNYHSCQSYRDLA